MFILKNFWNLKTFGKFDNNFLNSDFERTFQKLRSAIKNVYFKKLLESWIILFLIQILKELSKS
jgi:predicted component of viral defense system (DUF524 family)